MDILPAIDLLGGKVVRLSQGDYARETTYAPRPNAVVEIRGRSVAERSDHDWKY